MSAAPDDLTDFVRTALARAVPRTEIETALRKAGWTADQTRSALAGFADSDFPIPVPRPRPYLDAREAFVYLILFSTLYMSALHLGNLLFDIINAAFPDLAKEAGTDIYSRDPQTGHPYPYAVKGGDTYELCAAFARESERRSDFWSHGAGMRCFAVTARRIDP